MQKGGKWESSSEKSRLQVSDSAIICMVYCYYVGSRERDGSGGQHEYHAVTCATYNM